MCHMPIVCDTVHFTAHFQKLHVYRYIFCLNNACGISTLLHDQTVNPIHVDLISLVCFSCVTPTFSFEWNKEVLECKKESRWNKEVLDLNVIKEAAAWLKSGLCKRVQPVLGSLLQVGN